MSSQLLPWSYAARSPSPLLWWWWESQITITSKSGAGKTSTIQALVKILPSPEAWSLVSAGQIMRQFAADRKMSIEDFAVWVKNNPEAGYDRRCDEEMELFGQKNWVLAEGRLVHVFLPRAFHVLLTCPLEERARRRQQDPQYVHKTVDEVCSDLRQRDDNDRERYEKMYPGCMWESRDFDFVLNTSWSGGPEDVAERIRLAHHGWVMALRRKELLRS